MKNRGWLIAIAAMFVMMAILVFGWLGLAQVDHRRAALTDAVIAQKLRVAPVVENARIVAGLLFGELQGSLRNSPAPITAGREVRSITKQFAVLDYDRPLALRKAERELTGSLVSSWEGETDSEAQRYRRTLVWLFDRDLNILGQVWAAAVERTYFLSRDLDHAVSVPRWSSTDQPSQRAQTMLTPYPGDVSKGERQMLFTSAWMDPIDGVARQTILSPLFDDKGTWLGNAAVDFRLRVLDDLLDGSPLAEADWLLVDQSSNVLARAVSPRGEFSTLGWGQPLANAPVRLPIPVDGTQVNAGAYTVIIHQVPDSTLHLYGIIKTAWMTQDLPLVIAAGLAVILLLIAAFTFLGWMQRRSELRALENSRRAEAQVAGDRAQRDREASMKDFLAGVTSRLHRAESREAFAQVVLEAACTYANAQYGAFYLLEDSETLVPVAGHGILLSELAPGRVGQGLLGECAKTRRNLLVDRDSHQDFQISWGQGRITPARVDVLPIAQASSLLGVLVLAHLQAPETDHGPFHEALLTTVAVNLEIQKRNLATAAQAQALERQQGVLRETEAWSRGIIESSPDGMLVVNTEGTILMTNRQAEAIFGYAQGELIGQAIELLVPQGVRPRHTGLRDEFVRSAAREAHMAIDQRDLCAVCKDGTEILVEVGLTKLPPLADSGTCVCAWVKPILRS